MTEEQRFLQKMSQYDEERNASRNAAENIDTRVAPVYRFSPLFFKNVEYVPDANPLEMKGTLCIDIPMNQDVPPHTHRRAILKAYPIVKKIAWGEKLKVEQIGYYPESLLNSNGQSIMLMISRLTWHDWASEVTFARMLTGIARKANELELSRLIFVYPPILMWRCPIIKYLTELSQRFHWTNIPVIVCQGD